MKKTLLLMIATMFVISAMGQSVTGKTHIIGYMKLQNLENLQGLLISSQRLDTTVTETWNELGGIWVFSSRKSYAYSVVGLTTTAISSKRDATTSFLWENSGKTETTVDASGNTTLVVDYTWNKTTNMWVGSMKIEYTYLSGNLTSNSTYSWNTSTSQWIGLFRTEYTYSGGNLSIDIGLTWDSTLPIPAWVNSTKTEYTYAGGKLASDLMYDWDKINSNWGIATEKTEYSYSGGNLASATISTWDIDASAWVNSSKTDYTYTGGKMTLNIVSTWDLNTSAWVNASKVVSEYNDPDGRITLFSFYGWDAINSAWYGFLQNETSYGVLGPLSYTVTVGSGWDLINSQWVPQSRSTNWYSNLATGINKLSEKNIGVYPNPVKEFVVFDNLNTSESATVIIFDIQGKKVLEQQLSGNRQIAVNNLRKGLYIYKLYNNGTIYTGKLLKD